MSGWYYIGFGCIGLICSAYGFFLTVRRIRRLKRENTPKGEWHYVGKLQEVNLKTPVGLIQNECELVDIGLQCNDGNGRQFVLMKSSRTLMFAGKHLQMLLIKATMIDDNRVQFTAPNMPPLVINIHSEFLEPLSMQTKKIKELRKRLVTLQLLEGDAEHDKWFSNFLLGKDKGVRLYMNLKPKPDKNWWLHGGSDYSPFIALQTKSIEDLQARLPKGIQIEAKEFNGNLLIDTTTAPNIKAFDEDHWFWLRIGEDDEQSAYLRFHSYCYHASGPNINGDTMEYQKTADILSALKTYRLLDKPNDPVMGSYYTVRRPGSIKPNAKVYMQFSSKKKQQV